MKQPRRELRVEGAAELPHVISYLEQLAAALRSGAVRVHRGEEVVVLGPRGVIGFSLAVSDRGKRQKLSLELSWRKLAVPEADLDLVIAPAEVPRPAAEAVEEEVAAPAATAEGAEASPAEGAEASPAEASPEEASPEETWEPPMPGEVVLGEPE